MARAALESDPDAADWLTALALSLTELKQAADALPLFQRLIELQPGLPEHWSNLGNCLCEMDREREALLPLQRALAAGGSGIALHFACARALSAHGEPRQALEHVRRALIEAPTDPEIRLLHARILVMLDEFDAAGKEIESLRTVALDPLVRVEAANLLLQIGLYADASAGFASAIDEPACRLDAMLGLASVHERCNRLPSAEALVSALGANRSELNDKQRDLLLELEAQLASRRGEHAYAREQLQALLQGPQTDPMLRGDLWLKLGRCCDALGEPEAAMAALQAGHQIRYSHVTTTHTAMPRGDGLLAVLDADVPELLVMPSLRTPADPADPVFLVGFPRSGTTLLEQLLDAHPGLASFDEQPFLQRLVSHLNAKSPGYPEVLAGLDGPARRALRARYFSDVARVLPQLGPRRAVDKNPLNLVRLPLVTSLFPEAQVVLALRHPCDVVLSCYMQNFRSPAFSITFESLGSTARMYARVMAHYHGCADRLGLAVHTLRYEDLVADVAGTAKCLFADLDLLWDDQLIDFTEHARTKGAISTPSYSQVVQPVNRRAVGRWKRYRAHFDDEVLTPLMPWIERFGYAL